MAIAIQSGDVKLTNVGQLLARCWAEAEAETIRVVRERYWGPAEEHITFLFAGELHATVEKASNAHQLEAAFLKDLQVATPGFNHDVARHATGLVARVNFHRRRHESKKSAADLGVVIRRPIISVTSNGMRVETHRDHATGLLAQAKLGRRTGAIDPVHTWGRLKPAQVALFPIVHEYYSLLLYRLGGQSANDLKPFGWQLCKDYTVDNAKAWLRSDSFPQETLSPNIIHELVARKVGTEDPQIVNSIIDPATGTGAQAIEIQVFWPKGKGPPPAFLLSRQQTQKKHLTNLLRY